MSEKQKNKANNQEAEQPLLDYAETVNSEGAGGENTKKKSIKNLFNFKKNKKENEESSKSENVTVGESINNNEISSDSEPHTISEINTDTGTAQNMDESLCDVENVKMTKKFFNDEIKINAFGLFIGAAVLVVICVFATFKLSAKFYEGKYHVNQSTRVTFSDKNTDPVSVAKYQEIIDFIEDNYYTDYDVNDLIEGAIEGMVDKLGDKYSTYYGPNTMEEYTSFIEGTYSGIGVTLSNHENGKVVTAVVSSSPAEKAGVKIGDILIAVNSKKVSEIEAAEFSSLFAKNGEILKLDFILNDGKTVTREIKVEVIKESTVFTKDLDGGLKYIRISQFIPGTADEFKAAVDKLGKDCKGIVIDLRNNPGGYENEASQVADMILPEGIIATAKGRNGKVVKIIESDANKIDIPIVILINQNTASSSELITGAFRDLGKGKIVGVKSYGKALGQRNKVFSADGSGIVLSTSKYYTPSGECIDGVGIEPTKIVQLEESYKEMSPENIPEGKDLQLYAAMEELGVKVEIEVETDTETPNVSETDGLGSSEDAKE